ncbi:type II toxin-antitoxin system RelE family toxin [Methanofollis fontis]|uniref:Type II toxin-antitoxin system RelE/ParE family toxin n=1 Tax=Methanofollis fontis TaxID=2052832 RepID=A0A483CNC2_9EURY|nr:type II toxin-antitoxin system RelE/ParE family toxin [Methanofollis fontis]TAJ44562.1 type II toxin-antitoxin system RelE/ParE family toxin [Methanofollis fontis]
MRYSLIYSKRVQRKIRHLPEEAAVRIIGALELLAEEEYPHLKVKRLTNSPLFSLRVGVYRVILAFEHQQFVIMAVDVDHRKNVYDRL